MFIKLCAAAAARASYDRVWGRVRSLSASVHFSFVRLPVAIHAGAAFV